MTVLYSNQLSSHCADRIHGYADDCCCTLLAPSTLLVCYMQAHFIQLLSQLRLDHPHITTANRPSESGVKVDFDTVAVLPRPSLLMVLLNCNRAPRHICRPRLLLPDVLSMNGNPRTHTALRLLPLCHALSLGHIWQGIRGTSGRALGAPCPPACAPAAGRAASLLQILAQQALTSPAKQQGISTGHWEYPMMKTSC